MRNLNHLLAILIFSAVLVFGLGRGSVSAGGFLEEVGSAIGQGVTAGLRRETPTRIGTQDP